MISYWKQINFKPETTDMNEVDDVDNEEKEEDVPKTVDQVKTKPKMITLDTSMAKRYGGVVIKGYKKESEIDDVMETLKEAGLPFDYDKADLHINEKFGRLTIYIHDLKSETCIEMINNLHDEEKSGNKLSVYSLVEDTPTKNLGKELEELIHVNETAPNDTLNTSPSAPLDPSKDTDFFNDFLNLNMEPSKGKRWAD